MPELKLIMGMKLVKEVLHVEKLLRRKTRKRLHTKSKEHREGRSIGK